VIQMNVLNPFKNMVTQKPLMTIAAVVLVTLLMLTVIMNTPQDQEMDDTRWLPENEVMTAMEDIEDNFPAQTRNIPVVTHALTPEGEPSVLTSAFMIEVLEIEWALANDTDIANTLDAKQGFIGLPQLLGMLANPEATGFPDLIQTYENLTDSQVQELFSTARTIPGMGEFVTALVSTDLADHPDRAEATIFMVCLDTAMLPGETEEDRDERLEDIEERLDIVVEEQELGHQDPTVISNSKINKESAEADERTLGTLFPLALLAIIIIMAVTFRSVSDLVFSLLALVFTLIWVQGITSLLGFPPSAMGSIVPILLIGLGVDYGIHLTMRYRESLVEEGNINKAAGVAVVSAGAALLLAAFTDMVGFLSNGTSSIAPLKEFGVIVAFGILSAYVVFVTFVPACRVALDRSRLAKGKPLLSPANERRARRKDNELSGLQARLAKGMGLGATLAVKKPKSTLLVITVLTLVLLAMATQVTSSFRFSDFLAQDSKLTDEIVFMQENFDFSDETAIIYIEGDDLATPEAFAAMAATEQNLAQSDEGLILYQGGRGLSSPLSMMRDLADDSDVQQGGLYDEHFATQFSEADSNGDGVPDQNIPGLLDLALELSPAAMTETIHQDGESGAYTIALIKVKVNSHSMGRVEELHTTLKDDARPLTTLEEEGTIDQAVVTGEPIIFDVMLTAISDSMASSILITVIVSAVVLTFVFYKSNRSWTLGIITTLPVVMVLVWIMGTMFLLDIPLNVMTLIIGAITIGLGVTYAIHVTHRFTEEMDEHGDVEKAAQSTVMHTGSALFGAALTTLVGFGILALSPQLPMQQFGGLTALTILYSLAVSIVVQPSMLVLWARATRSNVKAAEPQAKEEQSMIRAPGAANTPTIMFHRGLPGRGPNQ